MTAVLADVVLVAGLAIVAASCLGVAVMDNPMDRLHLVTPAAMLGSVGVCAAVLLRSGLSASGLAALLVGAVIAGTSPFTSHAMARAIVVRGRSEGAEDPVIDGPPRDASNESG
ncbi:MAG: cation:proton antiporter [Acidimicrobiales bacterium]